MIYRKLITHEITLAGPHIRLRPLTESDWDLIVKWNNDPGVLFYSEGKDIRSWDFKELQQMYRQVSRDALLFIIEIRCRGGSKTRPGFPGGWKPVGDVWLQQMNLKHWLRRYPKKELRRLPICIGEKDEWGKGYGREVIGLLTDYAFEGGAEMVFACGVGDHNSRCLKAFEKCGFSIARKVRVKAGGKGQRAYDLVRRKIR